MADDLTARLQQLKVMAFDVDGVLTDGRLYYADDGSELRPSAPTMGRG